MVWQLSHRFDRRALPLADSHYNRQKIGSPQFVPPGRCLVLLSDNRDALWVTSWPFAEYVKHEWGGAWVCSCFVKRCDGLASDFIREAVAITLWRWPVPPLGMITFIDESEVRPIKRRGAELWGYSYLKAGFRRAICPNHIIAVDDCAACNGRTKGGLLAFQLLPSDMPEPLKPPSAQMELTACA